MIVNAYLNVTQEQWEGIKEKYVEQILKHAPAYQFKRPFWFNAADRTYMSAKWIVDWEVKED